MTRIPWSLYRLTQRAFSTSGSATKRTSSWPPQRKIFWLPSWFRPKTPPEWTEFDTMWNDASEEQRDLLRTQYDELQKRDWRTLSVDQLRNCYTVSYGPPDSPSFDRREKILVFFGTVIAISAGVGLFYFLQLFAMPSPECDTNPEYLEAARSKIERHRGYNLYDIDAREDPDSL